MTITLERIDESLGTLPCRTHDPEVFFAESPSDVEYAKGLCRTCPLITACLAAALERQEPWGVWGGEVFQAGVVIPRKRPRGRPRKHPVPNQAAAPARESDQRDEHAA